MLIYISNDRKLSVLQPIRLLESAHYCSLYIGGAVEDFATYLNSFHIFDAPWYKRKSFEHEKEFRILIKDASGIKPADNNKIVKVDLFSLIESIYVSPQSEDWFLDLVRRMAIPALTTLSSNPWWLVYLWLDVKNHNILTKLS